MAVESRQVVVDSTADVLASDSADSVAAPVVFLKNRDTSHSVYIGPQGVTTGTGFELKPADVPLVFKLENGNAIYGICAGGETARVDVLEVGD